MKEPAQELEEKSIQLSDISLLKFSLKSSNGKLYIDMRKWFKYQNQDEYLPSKKGIMLDLSEWKQSIMQLNSFEQFNRT